MGVRSGFDRGPSADNRRLGECEVAAVAIGRRGTQRVDNQPPQETEPATASILGNHLSAATQECQRMALSQIGKHVGKENREMRAHLGVLAPAQRKALKQVALLATQRGFYLGGGTAVALHLGHRRSIDFDWFIQKPLGDPMLLAQHIRSRGIDFTTSKVEAGTLHGFLAGVRFSFLEYPYPLLSPSVRLKDFDCSVASLDDLACMKLSALAQRGSKKDFVDIYALALKHRTLPDILALYMRKYSVEDMSHVLYGLAYFDDADKERMPRLLWKTDWKTIKKAISNWLGALPQ